jgi:hypothetical protein
VRRLVVALALGCALVAPAGAGAAQSVGLTPDPSSIKVYRYDMFGEDDGLYIEAKGFDKKMYAVRVGFPVDYEETGAKLPVHFEARGGTTVRPCLTTEPVIPAGARDLNTTYCLIITKANGFVATIVQAVPKRVPDFGGSIADAGAYDIYVSARPSDLPATQKVFPNPTTTIDILKLNEFSVPGLAGTFIDPDAPVLQAYPRWSKYYRGTLKHSATKHFPVLFGSLTFAGVGVYGPGNKKGAPTNGFGRNVYIDTFDSDYGPGWHRIMGVLTQPTNGTYCYEFSKKGASGGKTGISKTNTYRLTAIGPGLTPVVRVEFHGPTFPFGNANYNPLMDKWGTNLSDEQTAALKLQATLMGPNWARPVKGTDCAQTLRQLPSGFIP